MEQYNLENMLISRMTEDFSDYILLVENNPDLAYIMLERMERFKIVLENYSRRKNEKELRKMMQTRVNYNYGR